MTNTDGVDHSTEIFNPDKSQNLKTMRTRGSGRGKLLATVVMVTSVLLYLIVAFLPQLQWAASGQAQNQHGAGLSHSEGNQKAQTEPPLLPSASSEGLHYMSPKTSGDDESGVEPRSSHQALQGTKLSSEEDNDETPQTSTSVKTEEEMIEEEEVVDMEHHSPSDVLSHILQQAGISDGGMKSISEQVQKQPECVEGHEEMKTFMVQVSHLCHSIAVSDCGEAAHVLAQLDWISVQLRRAWPEGAFLVQGVRMPHAQGQDYSPLEIVQSC